MASSSRLRCICGTGSPWNRLGRAATSWTQRCAYPMYARMLWSRSPPQPRDIFTWCLNRTLAGLVNLVATLNTVRLSWMPLRFTAGLGVCEQDGPAAPQAALRAPDALYQGPGVRRAVAQAHGAHWGVHAAGGLHPAGADKRGQTRCPLIFCQHMWHRLRCSRSSHNIASACRRSFP